MDPVIRPVNSLLLIKLQSAEGVIATLDPTTDAVPFEAGSFRKGSPFTSQSANEANGSYVASQPMIVGQAVPLSFRAFMKGAGAGTTYTSSVKPPYHAPLQACGWRGQFTAAIAAAALAAGSTTTATLGTGFTGTAQLYTGMPLILSVGPGAGQFPLITNYTSGKLATLSDTLDALTTSTLAALPANWTYAGTSPADASARSTDHPCATVALYEDGNLYTWMDVRGVMDLEGETAKAGMATFNLSGTYMGVTTPGMPTNQVLASQSPPILTKGSGAASAALVNRVELPISRWALQAGSQLEQVADPNTAHGFGAGQLGGREPMFTADPLRTLASTRDAIAEIEAASLYPIALRFGQTAGNRWSLLIPQAQAVKADDGDRGQLRSDDRGWRCINPGRDAQARDMDRIISFS